MRYLALGDSISVDDYTGVPAGGAASQFARLIKAEEFQNLTRDGFTTDRVLDSLAQVKLKPDVITLTVGGNDFLGLASFSAGRSESAWSAAPKIIIPRLEKVVDRVVALGGTVILNTIYDPTDGENDLGIEIGIPPLARKAFAEINESLRALAGKHDLLLSDLESLFKGHGFWSKEPWIVNYIEPNLAGATAIAKHWFALVHGKSNQD